MSAKLDVDMTGRLAIVTGATGGIGKEIARGLALMGATVVIGARDEARSEAALTEIAVTTGNTKVSAVALDVSDVLSIRAFAAEIQRQHGRVDVLVNNAGAWFSERRESAQGHELTFATNVLGPHLLTKLLTPMLRAGTAARVVNVVSGLAANYDAGDLEFTKRSFDGFKAYAQSKQALRMLTWGQSARFYGTGVTANAAAPGFVKTDFNRNASGFMAAMINLSARLFAVSPAEGADTPLWAAVAPELAGVTGRYFEKRAEKDGKFREKAAIAELESLCDRAIVRADGPDLAVRGAGGRGAAAGTAVVV